MSIITVNTDNDSETIDFRNTTESSSINLLQRLNQLDNLLVNINKSKYQNSKEIVQYIRSIRSPEQITTFKITLLALMNFFQKTYVTNIYEVKLNKIPNHILEKLPWESVSIISKINNFPHLIGISGLRDNSGKIISRVQPREFLDGVLYQWILLNNHDDFTLDSEKLEVLPWIHHTLSNPTYILLNNAIKPTGTNFHADITFVRRIFNSKKYAFHLVGLKNEKNNDFAFKSQFAISRDRQYRIKKMFDLEKAVYDFYKEKKKVSR